jgi:hypothetical protein
MEISKNAPIMHIGLMQSMQKSPMQIAISWRRSVRKTLLNLALSASAEGKTNMPNYQNKNMLEGLDLNEGGLDPPTYFLREIPSGMHFRGRPSFSSLSQAYREYPFLQTPFPLKVYKSREKKIMMWQIP